LLNTDSRTEVRVFGSLDHLSQHEEEAFDIAIVPWSRSTDSYPWLNRLGRPPSRAIVGVDDSTNEAVFWLRDIDQNLLLDLSERLSGLHLIHASDIPNIASPPGDSQVVRGAPRHRTPIQDLLTWVELSVRRRLAENDHDAAGETGSIPGWTAGLSQIRAIIGGQAGETLDSLQSALLQHDQKIGHQGLVSFGTGISLSPLEQRLFALAFAPELDGRFQAAYGYLHNDRGYASITLLSDLLANYGADALTIRRIILDDGPIARFRLLEAQQGADGRIGPESALRVSDDIIEFMMQGRFSSRSLAPALSFASVSPAPLPKGRASAELLAMINEAPPDSQQVIQLIAPRSASDWAKTILTGQGHRVLVIDAARLEEFGQAGVEAIASKIARICCLTNALPLLEGTRALTGKSGDLAAMLLDHVDTLLVDLEHPWAPPVTVTSRLIKPFAESMTVDAAYWQAAAANHYFKISDGDASELAATRRDDASQVASICRHEQQPNSEAFRPWRYRC